MDIVTELSAVVLTHNEEKNLKKCLDSLQFCREILVIDNDSTDKTTEIAEQSGAVVYKRSLENDFAAQRNYALEQTKGSWILFVDADEIVPVGLQTEIKQAIKNTTNTAYYLKRRDYWWGQELKFGEVFAARTKGFIRLVQKNSGKWIGTVHEVFQSSGPVGDFRTALKHYPHQSVHEFLEGVNFYSTLRAKELQNKGKKTNSFEILFYPFGKFIWNYFIIGGWLDGAPGFAYAFFMSFHSFLVRAKLYQYRNIDQ